MLKFCLQILNFEDHPLKLSLLQLFFVIPRDRSCWFHFPCGRLLSFLGNHSWLKWDSLILEDLAGGGPSCHMAHLFPLSGTENFCSIRFLVTHVLLSSQLLGNKIRCLDCLAGRIKVEFGVFFPICSFAVHFIMCVWYLSQILTHKNLKIKSCLI